MKTKIEEAAKDYGDKAMGNMSPRNDNYGISHYNLIKGFIAGAEFMQGEVKELEDVAIINEGHYREIKAHNQIMREALKKYENIVSEYRSSGDEWAAKEALKKVGDV